MLADPNLLLRYGRLRPGYRGDRLRQRAVRATRATVLYAWEPTAVAVSGGMVPAMIPPDSDERDKARAMRLAEAGAQHAGSLGLDAEARIEETTASA